MRSGLRVVLSLSFFALAAQGCSSLDTRSSYTYSSRAYRQQYAYGRPSPTGRTEEPRTPEWPSLQRGGQPSRPTLAVGLLTKEGALTTIQEANDAEEAIQQLDQRRFAFSSDPETLGWFADRGASPEVLDYLSKRGRIDWDGMRAAGTSETPAEHQSKVLAPRDPSLVDVPPYTPAAPEPGYAAPPIIIERTPPGYTYDPWQDRYYDYDPFPYSSGYYYGRSRSPYYYRQQVVVVTPRRSNHDHHRWDNNNWHDNNWHNNNWNNRPTHPTPTLAPSPNARPHRTPDPAPRFQPSAPRPAPSPWPGGGAFQRSTPSPSRPAAPPAPTRGSFRR